MTLTRNNVTVILYLVELSIVMFILNTAIDFAIGSIYWEVGLGVMGFSIIFLCVMKNQRYDKLIISVFTWGLSFFLSDLPSFIVVVFGGGMI